MRNNKRPFLFLILGILLFLLLGYLIATIPPTQKITIASLSFPVVSLFFPLLFTACFFTTTFLLQNKRRGLFIASFLTMYLLLRYYTLTHIFFLFLLCVFFGMLELMFRKRE